MFAGWLLLAGALAVLNWLAAWRGVRWLIYLTKPGMMLALLAGYALAARLPGEAQSVQAWFFLAGGLCGLAGDIALMLPQNLFKAGLAAFLANHLFYIIAFTPTLPALPLPALGIGAGLALFGGLFYRRLSASLLAKRLRRMRLPVLCYVLAILPMSFSALLTLWRKDWLELPALLAALGGLFFLASDALLAWDRFVRPVPLARPLVMITYHLGQAGILCGAALHMAGFILM